jgi:hypothetical protein
VAEWRGALHASEIQALAEVESVLEEGFEVLSESPLRLRLGRLERGREEISLPVELIELLR